MTAFPWYQKLLTQVCNLIFVFCFFVNSTRIGNKIFYRFQCSVWHKGKYPRPVEIALWLRFPRKWEIGVHGVSYVVYYFRHWHTLCRKQISFPTVTRSTRTAALIGKSHWVIRIENRKILFYIGIFHIIEQVRFQSSKTKL